MGGCELTNDINSDWDYGVWWNYKDKNRPDERLVNDKRKVFNLYCNNVTKSYTDKVFRGVFGYSSMADITKIGFCIKKGERQAAHDGRFVPTPCDRLRGYIYQKPIDNRISQRWIRDLRIPVFMGKAPKIFVKDRSIEVTFDTGRGKKDYKIDEISNHLYPEEFKKVMMFAENAGLEIGEIDILRDNSTGLIYVVDINDIPGGEVFNKIKKGDYWERYMAEFMMKQL